jgi:outer membrane protein assembly factor BamC
MKFRNIVGVLLAASLLAGCSGVIDKKKAEYKKGAVQAPPLEVPPDLTRPEADQRYAIPGAEGGLVASYSEYTKQKTEQPCVTPASAPAAAPASTPAPVPAAKLQEHDGTKSIQLSEPFDRSWRKVGLALERAHMIVTDKDRSKGIYYVVAPLQGKKADKDKKQYDHLVVVRENQAGCEVAVTDGVGKSGTVSIRVVETLYQNLNAENVPGGTPSPEQGPGGHPPM